MKKHPLILLLLTFTILLIAEKSPANNFVLQEETFFNDEVKVMIPTNFFIANEKIVNQRYPDDSTRPQIIYSDESEKTLLSLNISENSGNKRDTIVKLYKLVKDDIRANYPDHKFLKTDVIRNRTLANIEVILPNSDGKMIYNMMAFRYVGGKFFAFNFSCPEREIPKWRNTAREIAENIKINK